MQEISERAFARGDVRPNFAISATARRIAGALDLPPARVAQIMASGASGVEIDFSIFDKMRGDHLEILRLLFHGESLSDATLKIRRELNPRATVHGVRQVRDKYMDRFKRAVHAGRISATLSTTSLRPLSREEYYWTKTATARLKPPPQVAENNPCRNRVSDASATFGQPVGHLQPPSVSRPAEVSATRPATFAIRPDFSQPSAGQIGRRLVDYDRLTGRPAGGGR